MRIAQIEFLEPLKEVKVSKWIEWLPKKWKEEYIYNKKPFSIIENENGTLTGVLSFPLGNGLPERWRARAEEMLEELKKREVAIVVPPIVGEFPRAIIPFAWGKIFTGLFAFEGAFDALKRQGKNPEEATFVIAGADTESLSLVLAGMGEKVNHLSFFHDDSSDLEEIQEELFEERGLPTEIFSSPKNPTLATAEVIILCGMSQIGYEHIVGRSSIIIDAVGNTPVMKKIVERRKDVIAIDGFYFQSGVQERESKWAEADVFIRNKEFRSLWRTNYYQNKSKEIYSSLEEEKLKVVNFQAMGRKVKITQKNIETKEV